MHKPLTILDIARLSGVGKSTVSRVLNQDPKVKDETRERVNAVIREHGFEPRITSYNVCYTKLLRP